VIRISLIEDDRAFAAEVGRAIQANERFELLGQAHRGRDGIDLVSKQPPDVLIIDLGLPDMSGIDCIVALRRLHANLKILCLTVFEDDESILAAIQAGANGYLLKDTTLDLLFLEIQVIMLGGASLTPRVAHRMAGHFRARSETQSPLSDREGEVLHYVALGFHYKDIADELDITVHTVRRTIERIYSKLNVHSRAEAIVKGRRNGLLKNLFVSD
jgi:two-component system NarL family response regulator